MPLGSGCGTPSKWPFQWLLNGGDPNHLQVVGWSSTCARNRFPVRKGLTFWGLKKRKPPKIDLSMLPAGWYPWDSYGTELHNHSNGWTQNRHQKTLGIDKQYSSQCDTYLDPWKLKWNWKVPDFQIGNTSSNGGCDVAWSCEFLGGYPYL